MWQEIVRRGGRYEGFFFWGADGFSPLGFELASGEANIFHAEGGAVFADHKRYTPVVAPELTV